MCSDLATASQACALFSATGILFMSWVGIMLMNQPFFIGGIDDVEVAKGSAFGAAGTFFFTFIASIFYMIKETQGRMSSSDGSSNGTSITNGTTTLGAVMGQQRHHHHAYGQVPTQAAEHDILDLDNVPQQFETTGGVFT